MEFPELALDSDTYCTWNSIGINTSSDLLIDPESIGLKETAGVEEDIYFSLNASSNGNNFCESLDSILNDPIVTTQDSVLKGDQLVCMDGAENNSDNQCSVSSLPIPPINVPSSKQTPTSTILVVADNSVSSSGRRGGSGGDPNSKNAIAARDNRQKKKKYINDLENSVMELKSENCDLRKENEVNRKAVASLQHEVRYLKGVIANQSTLSALLKSVSQTPGINLSSSFRHPSTDCIDKNRMSNCETEMDKDLNSQGPKGSENSHASHFGAMQRDKLDPKGLKRKSFVSQSQAGPKVFGTKKLKIKQECEETQVNIEDSETESTTDTSDTESFEGSLPTGICFHVSGSKVSLELCSFCNSSALMDHTYVK